MCRERRLVAVQTTYGALLPPDMMHSSSDMSTTLMLSDARISTSMGSGSLEFASEFPADAESDAQDLMFGSYEEEAEQVCFWPYVYSEQTCLACTCVDQTAGKTVGPCLATRRLVSCLG